ncbi:MAG: tRNA preQ1(34) S-adenosylmethionine ribosyltransferase-isomerase QueA [Planctomycetota bacterium]
MRVSEFEYDLPPRLIADRPAEPREAARLLAYNRGTGVRRHLCVADLPAQLDPGDLLVVNDTAVVPARLIGTRATKGRVEVLLLERAGQRCRGYLKPAAKVRPGDPLEMEAGALRLIPEERLGGGLFWFRWEAPGGGDLDQVLERVGRAPLPPYLRRGPEEDPARDRRDYQTVFAERPGAVAAPTAGLHFTSALLQQLADQGIEVARVTLHVGEGTFAPVRVEEAEAHRMHAEQFELSPETAAAVNRARERGGRVVAVGTTSARTLESCVTDDGRVTPAVGTTELFLLPGRPLRAVDGLLTNFHLPRSTLLMLVCALAGTEPTLALYREAVAREYRFYSFGDAMLIL